MSKASLQMRTLAGRFISHESAETKIFAENKPPEFHAFERMLPHLATLMGHAGFRGLLSRSLALSIDEVRWLRAVHVRADGSLEGLEDLRSRISPAELLEGGIVLLAQLLSLLVALIGENLTLRLAREIWPKMVLNDLEFSNGGNHEKAK